MRGEQRETEPTFPATIHPSSSCLSSCLYSSPSIHRSPTGPAGAEWMEVVRRVTRDTSDERYAPRFICYLRPFCHSTSLRSSFVSSACHSLCSLHSSSPTGRPERVEWKDEGVTRHQAKRDPEEEGRSRQAGGNRGRFLVSGLVSLSTLSPLYPPPRSVALGSFTLLTSSLLATRCMVRGVNDTSEEGTTEARRLRAKRLM